MKKYCLSLVFVVLLFSCLFLTGCLKNEKNTGSETEVYQIGVGWVDNMIDAHYKLQNSPNKLAKDANLEYMNNSVNYYKETLKHATEEEQKRINDYLAKKSKEIGVTPEYFLNYGGKNNEND